MQWSRRSGCWDQRCHLIVKTDLPRPRWFDGCLTELFLIWSNGNYSCCAPTHWLSYGVNMRFSALQWRESGDIWTQARDQLPGSGVTAMWMMFCVISELIRAIMWHKTSDATTGVHVMFHTMPMVNVMFSQSLICCFKNHRTRNITGLSILCGCFPSGLSSAGHRRVLWWWWGVVRGHVRCQAVRWLRPLVNISPHCPVSGHSGVTGHCLHWPR